MEGESLKEILVKSGIDLNKFEYIENSKKYEFEDIHRLFGEYMKMPLGEVRKEFTVKFGEETTNFILKNTYGDVKDNTIVDLNKVVEYTKNIVPKKI